MKSLGVFEKIAAAAVISVGLSASAAQAVTVGIYSDDPGGDPIRATLTCDFCSVLLYTSDGTDSGGANGANNIPLSAGTGSYGYSQADATTTDFGELFVNSFGVNPPNEAQWFNSIMGTSVSLTDADKTENSSDLNPFGGTSTAAYVIAKVGRTPNYTIIRNDNVGGAFTFSWLNESGGGAGLSHYTEVAAIPIPAGGVLLLTALGGLGLAARRKRKAV